MTDRITVTLAPRVAGDLGELHKSTGLSKTDLVNRALRLYVFVEQQHAAGRALALFDGKVGEFQLVHLV